MPDTHKPTIICLLGIHASGKTTIGKQLDELGIPYLLEIGNDLIKTVDFNSPEKLAWFDREIMERELERDDSLVAERVEMVVIETWHIGNIAYAQIRNPSIADEYVVAVKKTLHLYNPLFIFLDISEETFRERANKPIPIGVEEDIFVFYQNIRNNILSTLDELDIEYHSIDANQEEDQVLRSIKELLSAKDIYFQKEVLSNQASDTASI